MKFDKELKSRMVPEWEGAYMDYEFLKKLLKDIQHFRQKNVHPPATNPPGLTRRLTLYRAFSGLTVLQRTVSHGSSSSATHPHHHLNLHLHDHHDIESQQPILVNTVKKLNGEDGYETTFLKASDEGGEYELVYFRRLDDELNKVIKFYKGKVEEVMKEATELNKQMDALIAFRVKVDKPKHEWFHSNTVVEMSGLDPPVATTTAVLSSSTSSGMRASRRVPHMDMIDEDRSIRAGQQDASNNHGNRQIHRPAPIEILDRVTLNKAVETPRSTIKGILNIPMQTELKFSKENLNKLEDQLRGAFVEFYHKLRLLKSYSFLNILAFSKIMKKYDKITLRHASKPYMKMVDDSYIGSSDEVTKVMERVEAAFIKHFSNSNRKKGLSTLKPRPKRERHRITVALGFFAGCSLSLILALILIIRAGNILDKPGRKQYMDTMFPLYSFFFFIVLHLVLYAANIYFWRKYRVNYPFIFGFKPGTALGFKEVLLVAFALAVLALGCVLANLDMEMDPKTGDYKAFTELLPLGLLILLTLIMICPFNIIYRSSRFFFLTCAFHVFCAPLYKVTLPDFFVGDQLSSQFQAFRSVEFYICYYTSGDYRRRENNCDKNDVYVTFNIIVAVIPFWWRGLQCVRRYFEEKDFMQVLNAMKYFSVVISLAIRIAYTRSGSTEWEIVAWVTSVIAAIAVTYWDIVYDWGLLERKSVNPWLRDKLLIPHKSVYFAAIVLNVILRLVWVQALLDIKISFIHRQTMITIVASLEIIRRGSWNFFRLENEHLNNVGRYRAFKSVPLPFNYDEDDDDDDKD